MKILYQIVYWNENMNGTNKHEAIYFIEKYKQNYENLYINKIICEYK